MSEDLSREAKLVFLTGWLMVAMVILTGMCLFVGALTLGFWLTIVALPLTAIMFLSSILYNVYQISKGKYDSK